MFSSALVRRVRWGSGGTAGAALAVLLLVAVAAPQSAQAQTQWRQTFQVITPIAEQSPASAVRDSIVDIALRENIAVKRSPDDEAARPMSEIENELLNEGLDFTSANRLFIQYDFEAQRGELRRDIKDLYFIYRPEGAEGTDLPIMHVSTDTTEAFAKLLANSGMRLRTNEAAFEPFREQLMFQNLPESQLVALGGNVIRDAGEAEDERMRLLRSIQRFLY